MTENRYYDTVTFDVRDNATMLFFAKTTAEGDIDDYLLLMRTVDEDFDQSTYIEVNEKQFGGHDLIREAAISANTLTLTLYEPARALGGISQIVLTYADTPENKVGIENGLFRVLGDVLVGGTS